MTILRGSFSLARLCFTAISLSGLAGLAVLAASCGDAGPSGDGGDGGAGSGANGSNASTGPKTEHGCFSTEAECDGKCVDLSSSMAHCGACGNACVTSADRTGSCVDGSCAYECNAGFVDQSGTCRNLFGAYEPFPNDCQACNTANPHTGQCSCPGPSTPISLAVQSDCPNMPIRSSTRLNVCTTTGASAETDFGGVYQIDDLDGWCGATAQCRIGNPLAGGACACPAGTPQSIALRSIIRLPCGPDEVGTQIVFCGNKDVPVRSFGGAYQYDDFVPNCRVANPWTGDCTCPAGTTDLVFRVMVDGAQGIYGSTIHICAV